MVVVALQPHTSSEWVTWISVANQPAGGPNKVKVVMVVGSGHVRRWMMGQGHHSGRLERTVRSWDGCCPTPGHSSPEVVRGVKSIIAERPPRVISDGASDNDDAKSRRAQLKGRGGDTKAGGQALVVSDGDARAAGHATAKWWFWRYVRCISIFLDNNRPQNQCKHHPYCFISL